MAWNGAWPSQALMLSRQRLSDLKQTASNLDSDIDDQVSGAVAKFLVVRSAGHIEFTVDECIHSFASAKSHPGVAQYVRAGLFGGRNPTPGKLVDHLGRMSKSWADTLTNYLNADDEEIKRELSLLVDRRNLIAHGQNESIGMRKALKLCDLALDLGDLIVKIIDPR